jgi:outer membrane protein insertion porin family
VAAAVVARRGAVDTLQDSRIHMYRLFSLALALAAGLWVGAFPAAAHAQDSAPAPTPQQQPTPPPPAQPPAQQPPAEQPPAVQPPAEQPSAPPQTPASPAPAAPAAVAPGQPTTRLPPAGSPPLVRFIELTFPSQGNVSVIEPQTYLYYIQAQVSRPSDGVWVPYDQSTEKTLLEDFKRLWGTNFLEDLSIEVVDDPYPNGVVGKRIIYKMEERQRVKIVDYDGSKKVEQTKIDEKLKEENLQIRLDTFIDPGLIRRVEGVVRGMMSEKGYQYAQVTHDIQELPSGPKLVHLTFHISEGPKVKIKRLDFDGNKALSDGKLTKQMKENRPEHWLSWITGRGTYQEAKFEEDAEKITENYRNKGYIAARIGQPEVKVLNDSKDGKTRYIELKVPVIEGDRYRIGSFAFDGNTVVKSEALRQLFNVKEGEYYSEKRVRKGMQQARELYGTGGYWEFTGYPDLKPRNIPDEKQANDPAAIEAAKKQPAIVDVTMRLQQGEQYFVNRITFVGNTTTRDNVIRREFRLLENGVFNSESLKFSVRRINQLGYFRPLEEGTPDNPKIEKTPGQKNKVDVTLKFEEQNRNQLTFGAGVSQFEGFFGQLSFQTSNFMGRGESVTFAVLAGSQVQNYQLAFSEPYLFDRPITAGLDLFKREIRYYLSYTQESVGGNLVTGFPVRDFTRMFLSYSLQVASVKDINEVFLRPEVIARNPFLADALLVGEGGKRTVSQISPSLVHNTIDNPIFPNSGKRFTLGLDFAGVGGDVNFYKPRVEGVWWKPMGGRRFTFGVRGELDYVRPFGSTTSENLPIFERLFAGGEYSVRGYDIRSIGPRDIGTPTAPGTFIVLGGNKLALFNAEYHYSIAGPFRVLAFFDAGQVQDFGHRFRMDEFVMSTGAEVRFFMPVLNVPFRLIYAHNMNREGVFDNNLQPAKANTFRFAVGSTF